MRYSVLPCKLSGSLSGFTLRSLERGCRGRRPIFVGLAPFASSYQKVGKLLPDVLAYKRNAYLEFFNSKAPILRCQTSSSIWTLGGD